TITAGDGDDTIIYSGGDDVIAGNLENFGTDTLDLSQYAAADVTFAISGADVTITTPDGVITLQDQTTTNVYRTNIENILFSDGTLDSNAAVVARAVLDQGTDGDDT
ncbi:hypothetical protein, partial [Yoonia sp. I 8.24]|uniref:hypothetical protein n=1 Tax=Yoonia sp. I 8.24 TaxID=1537229 RepID=UPI001EDEF164